MSAFILDHEHINVLVQAYAKDSLYLSHQMSDLSHWDELGQLFIDLNTTSVNARYNETSEPATYRYAIPRKIYEPVEVLKAIQSFRYQSCEVEGAEDTKAWKQLADLEQAQIHCLDGYEDAEWEIRAPRAPERTRPPHPVVPIVAVIPTRPVM